jgi:hypothetical protein
MRRTRSAWPSKHGRAYQVHSAPSHQNDLAGDVRPAARWSATKERSAAVSSSAGRRLKKSPKRKAPHRLRRRKRIERTATPETHLGAEGANALGAIEAGRWRLLEIDMRIKQQFRALRRSVPAFD